MFGVTVAIASLMRAFRYDLNLVENVLHINPQEKYQGVKSGNLGGQATGPPLPIHLPVISVPRCFLTWRKKCGGTPSCWRIFGDGNWGSAYSSSMSKYEHPVTVFFEKKNGTINLLCIKPAHMFTEAASLELTSDM
jgi:hypothetical protein